MCWKSFLPLILSSLKISLFHSLLAISSGQIPVFFNLFYTSRNLSNSFCHEGQIFWLIVDFPYMQVTSISRPLYRYNKWPYWPTGLTEGRSNFLSLHEYELISCDFRTLRGRYHDLFDFTWSGSVTVSWSAMFHASLTHYKLKISLISCNIYLTYYFSSYNPKNLWHEIWTALRVTRPTCREGHRLDKRVETVPVSYKGFINQPALTKAAL